MDNCKSNGSGSVGNPFSTSAVSQGAIAAAGSCAAQFAEEECTGKTVIRSTCRDGRIRSWIKAKVIYDFKPAADDELAARLATFSSLQRLLMRTG